MPYYRCIIPENSITFDQRQNIATAFTDVHCSISAAPRNFVHVQFIEVDGNTAILDSHGSGNIIYDTPYFIAGGNRAGRAPEVRQQILNGLIEQFCQIVATFYCAAKWKGGIYA